MGIGFDPTGFFLAALRMRFPEKRESSEKRESAKNEKSGVSASSSCEASTKPIVSLNNNKVEVETASDSFTPAEGGFRANTAVSLNNNKVEVETVRDDPKSRRGSSCEDDKAVAQQRRNVPISA